ncbi:helix-turn-helix domain-containing protein [Saccharopolyspora phatthalungensis]|uniref:Transcriptional regulator with XRE-family HTH domain n=1 Tax=Saccharopolyspora phatthalungensis TaxID=664693 RepID=A0A840Q9U9_9PSEU|nr:helix-turn-helix transcriptional regulator [Saccharopolyspora phatthalungensis]MBB5156620.1 transcriptional regulator with XRE-family HTH domain [Saccharopolyspora phatthalungensis]
MVGKSEHTPKARALGAEIRKCRLEAGLTQQELAAQIGVSHVSVSRYESGTRSPKPEDVAQILATLGVNGEKYAELVDMSRSAEQLNWLVEIGPTGIRRELTTLIELEKTATTITDVATGVIPGLLQSGDYARAVMSEAPGSDLEARVAMRVGRRDVLMSSDPPVFVAFIAEAALREPIGGCAILADQLRLVRKMSELPNVVVQVLPAQSQQWHPAHAGSFILFEFAKTESIVHVEHLASGAFLYSKKEVAAHAAAVTRLRELAMTPDRSADCIAEIIEGLEGGRP